MHLSPLAYTHTRRELQLFARSARVRVRVEFAHATKVHSDIRGIYKVGYIQPLVDRATGTGRNPGVTVLEFLYDARVDCLRNSRSILHSSRLSIIEARLLPRGKTSPIVDAFASFVHARLSTEHRVIVERVRTRDFQEFVDKYVTRFQRYLNKWSE